MEVAAVLAIGLAGWIFLILGVEALLGSRGGTLVRFLVSLAAVGLVIFAATVLAGAPKAELRVSPRMPLSGASGGAAVTLFFEIKNPGPELYCPRIEWEISGARSMHESDCQPWEELDPKPESVFDTKRVLLGQGQHLIKVRVTQGKASKVVSQVVEVR